ncbi:hypothetical protein [Phytoactinopolyspora endophytica]|uniref:hypothetical protein n=1 Tax=Phytoactinopolyspora endophytica TaxID=1642495 RepID=UPI0013EAF7B5|nr:hypothetical protein [Phytoactinopolyspora endophytica]
MCPSCAIAEMVEDGLDSAGFESADDLFEVFVVVIDDVDTRPGHMEMIRGGLPE